VIKHKLGRSIALSLTCTVLYLAQAHGQAPGNWPLPHNDAEHSGWQKAETKLSKDTVAGQFKFLWKIKLEKKAKGPASFSEALLAPRLINAEGFKDLVIWGSKDTVYAVDSELGTVVWQKHFDVPAKQGTCGASPLPILVEPPHLINFNARRTPGTPPPPPPPAVQAGARRLGGSAGGGGFGFRGIYILTGDGYLHEQILSTGADFAPAVKFLPVRPGISNGLNIEGNVLYAATSHGCGEAPNAMWVIDLAAPDYPVANYSTKSVSLQASMGPTLSGGVAYLVTGSGPASEADQVYPNSIVALSGKELKVKDRYTPAGDANELHNLTPVAFTFMQQELLAAPGKDGSFVLLDSKSLGGSDHHTPLFQTPSISSAKTAGWGGMTHWQDANGTAWLLASVSGPLAAEAKFETNNGAATHGSIVAFKVAEQDGKTVLIPAWSSQDLVNPAPPVVANGLVIALSEGDRKTHARIYVLDANTGKQLYASGSEIATYAQMSGVSVGDSHAFFTTHDGTLYCFGIGMEH
jgi:outer membrane protein assembly factor BamB